MRPKTMDVINKALHKDVMARIMLSVLDYNKKLLCLSTSEMHILTLE